MRQLAVAQPLIAFNDCLRDVPTAKGCALNDVRESFCWYQNSLSYTA